ncbi:FecR family protein [Puteibacter caeruleilacunae]|nr:FecR family protein [Puteibacter caeruleilacunae]
MKSTNENTNFDRDISEFLNTHEVKFKASKEDEWKRLQGSIESRNYRITGIIKYAAAILVVALIGGAMFYTRDVECRRGEHLMVELPDGSTVKMNAESKLSYRPVWWYVARAVKLEGEAFFQVQKGSKFNVNSPQGTVQVLGTSFNVFARDAQFEVACVTGRVMVYTLNEKVELTPGENVIADIYTGKVKESADGNKKLLAWTNNKLHFHRKYIIDVLKEIERQYDVQIQSTVNKATVYSGNVSLKDDVFSNLKAICEPFNFQVSKTGEGSFRITK